MFHPWNCAGYQLTTEMLDNCIFWRENQTGFHGPYKSVLVLLSVKYVSDHSKSKSVGVPMTTLNIRIEIETSCNREEVIVYRR